MRRLIVTLNFLLVVFPALVVAAPDYKHLTIDRCGYVLFCGTGKKIRVEFNTDQSRPDPEQFPEPPLTIRRNDSSAYCRVTEGDIWVRSSVYLREDEQVLLVEEFSGSGSNLVQYATDDCRELRRIDVSARVWEINEDKLLIGEQCRGKKIDLCKVKRQRELTLGSE